jgi:hypothetical protein
MVGPTRDVSADIDVEEPPMVGPTRDVSADIDVEEPPMVGPTRDVSADIDVEEPPMVGPTRDVSAEMEVEEPPMVGPVRDVAGEKAVFPTEEEEEEMEVEEPPMIGQPRHVAGPRAPPPPPEIMDVDEPDIPAGVKAKPIFQGPPVEAVPVGMKVEEPPMIGQLRHVAGPRAPPPPPEIMEVAQPVGMEVEEPPMTRAARYVAGPRQPAPPPPIRARPTFKKKAKKRGIRTREERSKLFGTDVVDRPAPQTATKPVYRPEPKKQVKQTRDLLKAGLTAVRKKQRAMGFKVLSKPIIAAKPKLTVQRAEPITVAPVQPPRKPERKPEGIPMPPKRKTPKLTVSRSTEVSVPGKEQPKLARTRPTGVSIPGKKKPKLTRGAPTAVSIPGKPAPKLERKESAVSFRAPKPKKAEPRSPKRKVRFAQPTVVYKERPGRGTGSSMKVAPTQQVTVTPTQQSGAVGLSGLSAKIDELLRASKESKRKGKQKSAYAAAKKQYKAYRKKALANVKAQNTDIRKREVAKINKLPVKQRSAARKKLKEALKARADKVKTELPSKVQTPGQLRNLMTAFRTLKV